MDKPPHARSKVLPNKLTHKTPNSKRLENDIKERLVEMQIFMINQIGLRRGSQIEPNTTNSKQTTTTIQHNISKRKRATSM